MRSSSAFDSNLFCKDIDFLITLSYFIDSFSFFNLVPTPSSLCMTTLSVSLLNFPEQSAKMHMGNSRPFDLCMLIILTVLYPEKLGAAFKSLPFCLIFFINFKNPSRPLWKFDS